MTPSDVLDLIAVAGAAAATPNASEHEADEDSGLIHRLPLPPRHAEVVAVPDDLPPLLVRRLERAGITELWSHQVAALTAVRAGDDGTLFDRAVALELIAPTDDPAVVRVLLPDILAAGRALLTMGVSFARSLDVLASMREHAAGVARIYVDLFDEQILSPWDARGRPPAEWRAIRESLEIIRPIAGEALLAVFNQTISKEIAASIATTVPDDL